MNSIGSFTGLASGIQWADLIDQIMALETARRVTPFTNQATAQQARRDKWTVYEGLLGKLSSAVTRVRDGSAFDTLKTAVTSAADGKQVVSASASSTAAPGTYQLEVIALAKADKLSSGAFASTSEQLGVSGEFYVNGRRVEVSSTDTLLAVRDKINALNSGTNPTGVTATVLSTSSTEHRLVLSSSHTGTRGIELTDGDSGALEALGVVGSTTVQNTDPTDSSRTHSGRVSSTTTALAAMLGVTAPPAQTTIVVDGRKIAVDLENDSLLSIMNRIASAGGDASLVEEKVGGSTYHRLSVEGTVTADGTAGDPAASQRVVELLGFVTKERASVITAGSDAVFRIDGFAMTRRTNTVSDAIAGVTLNLLSANGSSRTATATGTDLSVATDPHTIDAGSYSVVATTNVVRSTSDTSAELDVLAAPGTASAGTYDVQITTAASVARATGAGFGGSYSELVGSDTLTVTDGAGKFGTVTLSNGMTTDQIVDDLNNSFTANGAALLASNVGGQLRIEATGAKGASSTFTVSSSDANVETNLGIADGSYNGTNVAGTIGGLAATGDGEVLTGAAGAVAGLEVQYTGTATGTVGSVTVADTAVIDSVTIGGVAAEWDAATGTIRGAAGTDFEGLVLDYSGPATDGQIGQVVVEGEIAANISVSRDLDVAVARIQDVAKAFNELVAFFNSQRGDPNAPLYANGTLRSMQRSVTQALLTNVEGLTSGSVYTRAAVAGVSLNVDGNLTVDTAKLKTALETNLVDVRTLFSSTGSATNSEVISVVGSAETKAGSYALEITTAATQATQLGAVWGGTYTASDGVSDTLTITDSANGKSVDFVATQGMALSEAVVELTALFAQGGLGLVAEDEGGALRIRHKQYGSEPGFTLAGPEAASRLGLSEGTFNGTDVAGTIDGAVATGKGRVLTGADGTDVEGLKVTYSGSATGSLGTVSYVLGVGGYLDRAIAPITRTGDGLIASQLNSIDGSIQRLNDRAEEAERRLEIRRETMQMQFLRMEQALAMLNSQGQWLSSQIKSLQLPGTE